MRPLSAPAHGRGRGIPGILTAGKPAFGCRRIGHRLVIEKENYVPLVQFVIVLVVIGVILWLVNTYIPMSQAIKNILNVVVIIAVIIFALDVFGVLGSIMRIRIGR